MRCLRHPGLLLLAGLATQALAAPEPAPTLAEHACTAPARAAELAFELPAGLLGAIGRMETGRRTGAGTTEAWPWSANAAGQGYFLPSRAEAIALVASLQARGVRSIDVGCFQMNLLHHPDAFSGLDDAFDPDRNAMAAARFLRRLRDSSASWEDAVGRYHSGNPALGVPYMRQVWARWLGTAPEPSGAAGPSSLSRVAALVRVIVPGGAETTRGGAARLPVVFTPNGTNLRTR